MCQINEIDKPYNKRSKKRAFAWKVVETHRGLYAPYMWIEYNKRGWMKASKHQRIFLNDGETQIGFHVIPTKREAKNYLRSMLAGSSCRIARVEVADFIKAGRCDHANYGRCERWDRMRILNVYE